MPQLPPIGAEVSQPRSLPPLGGEVSQIAAARPKDASTVVINGKRIDRKGIPDDVWGELTRIESGAAKNDPDMVVNNITTAISKWATAGPHAVAEGVRNLLAGNYAKGAHQMITGAGVTALPMVAPELLAFAGAAPITAAVGTAVGMGGQAATQAGARALGATPDQAALAGDIGGLATGIGATVAAPRVGRVLRSGPLTRTTNPAEAAAVQFGEERGIPMDAGTVTGSQFVKNAQKKLGSTLGGSAPVEAGQRAAQENLTRVGADLAAEANAGGAPASAISAGEGVRNTLTRRIQALHGEATNAYAVVRASDGAVNLTPAKQQLMPLYQRLTREAQLVPLQGGKAKTLTALDRLMSAPEVSPISVVDEALGDIKAMARGAEMPELRTGGQATAAQAVSALDAQVRSAARQAGPEVLAALLRGRAATTEKYAVADTLDLFGAEPRQVFNQLTAGKDLGLNKLRALQQHAPSEVPTVARGILEEMMDTATAEGKFAHTDKLWADWQRLGGQTKSILFPNQGQVQSLDNFFLLAKKLGENPNPSGTASVMGTLNLTQAAAYLPAKGLAKLLYTPGGVRWLTRVATTATPSGRAAVMAQLPAVAKQAGIPVLAPATADQERNQRPPVGPR